MQEKWTLIGMKSYGLTFTKIPPSFESVDESVSIKANAEVQRWVVLSYQEIFFIYSIQLQMMKIKIINKYKNEW